MVVHYSPPRDGAGRSILNPRPSEAGQTLTITVVREHYCTVLAAACKALRTPDRYVSSIHSTSLAMIIANHQSTVTLYRRRHPPPGSCRVGDEQPVSQDVQTRRPGAEH